MIWNSQTAWQAVIRLCFKRQFQCYAYFHVNGIKVYAELWMWGANKVFFFLRYYWLHLSSACDELLHLSIWETVWKGSSIGFQCWNECNRIFNLQKVLTVTAKLFQLISQQCLMLDKISTLEMIWMWIIITLPLRLFLNSNSFLPTVVIWYSDRQSHTQNRLKKTFSNTAQSWRLELNYLSCKIVAQSSWNARQLLDHYMWKPQFSHSSWL